MQTVTRGRFPSQLQGVVLQDVQDMQVLDENSTERL